MDSVETRQAVPPSPRSRRRVLATAIALAAVIGLVTGRLAAGAGRLPVGIGKLELAGLPSATGVRSVLDQYASAFALDAAGIALLWDFAFIGVYATTLTLLLLWITPQRRRARAWVAITWVAALSDVAENVLLLRVLGAYGRAREGGHAALAAFPTATDLALSRSASAASLLKFALLALVAGHIALLARTDLSREPSRGLVARWRGLVAFGRTAGVVLRPIWFHVAAILGVAIALTMVPQAQDVVRRIGEVSALRGGHLLPGVAFVLATALWAWTAWFWTRFLLTARCAPPEPEFQAPLSIWLMTWAPRLLAFSAFAGAAAALWTGTFDGRGGRWKVWLVIWGAAEVAAGLIFFWALVRRRRWVARSLPRLAAPQLVPGQMPVQDLLGMTSTRIALLVSSSIAVLLVLAYAVAPVRAGRLLGTAPVLLLASCAWIPLGSAIMFAGRRAGIPVVRWIVVLLVVASMCNDNHRVPSQDGAELRVRETLDERLGAWLDEMHRRHPSERVHRMYLVATEGGGIRAAYWTAGVLERLEEESVRVGGDQERFSDRLFAISAVSGGSLGAITFAAQLADGIAPDHLREDGRAFLGQDLLSPVLGALLFPDLVQQFVPHAVFPDRARALERTWEARWRERPLAMGSRRLEAPFLQLFQGPRGQRLPVLLLNATRVESGTRVIVTNLAVQPNITSTFPDATDAFELAAFSLPLSTAAHLSARFPFVSPAATFDRGHVVDGGYFENSGASTLADLLAAIEAHGDDEPGHRIEPFILVITNGDSVAGKPMPLEEMLAPIQALLHTRSARSVYAVADLQRQAQGRCRQLGVRERNVPLPLGWMLSELAQQELENDLANIGWTATDGPTCRAPLACSCAALTTEFARAVRAQPAGPPKAEPAR